MNYLVVGGSTDITNSLIKSLSDNMANGEELFLLYSEAHYPQNILDDLYKKGVKIHCITRNFITSYAINELFFYNRIDNVFFVSSVDNSTLRDVLSASYIYHANKVVFASSANVYGNAKIPTTELHPYLNSRSLENVNSIYNELIANYYADDKNLKIVGLRLFDCYGPNYRQGDVYEMIKKLIQNKHYVPTFHNLDLIHASDVGRFFVDAMNKDLHRGKFIETHPNELNNGMKFDGYINIGSGESISCRNLFIMIKSLLKDEFWIESSSTFDFNKVDIHPLDIVNRQSDNSIRKTLGETKVDLRDGLISCIEAQLKEEEK
jgi:nucleoside-diphosphate-sugar epimerase